MQNCVGSEAPDWHKLAAEPCLVMQQVLASVCQAYLTQQQAPWGTEHLYTTIQLISSSHYAHLDMLGA